MVKLPEKFLERMRNFEGLDFSAFLASYESEPSRALHVNLHKISSSEFETAADFPISPIEYIPDAFTFECDRIGTHPLHHAGAFYVQEPSAMMPVSMLSQINLPKFVRILDLCAAPGGKSSQAANLLYGRDGYVVSNEIVPKRAQILYQNIERLGIKNSCVSSTDAQTLADKFPSAFDIVIVDAPCSGEGMFRKDPTAVAEWSTENVEMCARRQRDIIDHASRCVAPDGYMVYSTCTFSYDENEGVLSEFLMAHPEFSLCDLPCDVLSHSSDGIGAQMSRARRFYPHIMGGEGQFAALLHKSADADANCHVSERVTKGKRDIPPSLTKGDLAVLRSFVEETLGKVPENTEFELDRQGNAVIADVRLLKAEFMLNRGVRVGKIVKGRIVPDHRYFMAYGSEFLNKAELSREQADLYTHGESFACNAFSGYGVVTYKNCVLGGCKISDGMLKNHYPKGLRRMGDI